MLGYILVQYNLETKRYQGFRMGEEDTTQAPDELFVTMEEFPLWTQHTPKYIDKAYTEHRYLLYVATLPDSQAMLLEPYIATLNRRFNEWKNEMLPTSKPQLIDTIETIKKMPNIDETIDKDLDALITLINLTDTGVEQPDAN
jgi:hypothetical protein